MEFATWGDGPRTLLFLQGSPTSSVPSGRWGWLRRRYFVPYVEAGHAIWVVTRQRQMPPGHSMRDIAADYAAWVDEHLGGRADLVLGQSFGGQVAQYLAGLHPSSVGHLVLMGSGLAESDWAKDVNRRVVAAVERGDRRAAGAALAEYVLPSVRAERLRRIVGPFMARSFLSSPDVPIGDVVVELEAEIACNCGPVLPRIQAPSLIISGSRDLFFPDEIVAETARLIEACEVVRYEGKGHVGTCSTSRAAADVLDFVGRTPVA